LSQKSMGTTITNAFRSTSDNGNFAGEIWDLIKLKLLVVCGEAVSGPPKFLAIIDLTYSMMSPESGRIEIIQEVLSKMN
jgi:hypothetical protein